VSAADKTTKPSAVSAGEYRIPSTSGWAGAWKIAAGIGAVGLLGAAAGWSQEPTRFAYSYLFAFFLVLTVSFGSMFFILVERLCRAGWSVTVRRTAEFFASSVWVMAILFIPVFLSAQTLYPWLTAKHGGGESGIEGTAHAQTAPAGEPAPAPAAPPAEHAAPGGVEGHPGMMMPPGHGAHPPDHMRPTMGRGGHAEQAELDEALERAQEHAEEETLAKKAAWLSRGPWMIRIPIYFAVWIWIGFAFLKYSTNQDGTKDPKLTLKAERLAPAATFLFGYTLTGAAFDWLMSMLPTWYSTIFGVTVFAGSVVCMYATMILVTMSLREAGLLKNAVNVEHFHDMGKLMFGFLVFWAYTSFAQFMLIWYAAIPEETDFFHHRWDVGPWAAVSLLIVLAHFVAPFFILLSRNVKRRPWALRIGATWLIVMHVVEMYWFVLPYYGGGELTTGPMWIDASCLVGVAGVYLAVVFHRMTKHPLIPVGDPRLSRALTFENA
jgi:hypothetical protein